MPTAYKVVGRSHRRTAQIPQHVVYPNGSTAIVMQPGPMVEVPVNAIIEDVTAEELAAFPDRFRMATGDEVKAWEARKAEVRDTFLPAAPEVVDPKRLELQQQIAHLTAQLNAMPGAPADPSRAMLEHAPVDPVTSERAALEREALRQSVADHQQAVAVAHGMGQPTPEMAHTAPMAKDMDDDKDEDKASAHRAASDRNPVGGARSESRK